jgi:O-acetyl-ADP-ribose deacetylase (regulator of RNase III)
MLTFVRGNLFESPAQALVNTVNTEGVMGKGIALGFKQIFPDMFAEYQAMCESGKLGIGKLHIWRAPQRIIVNFPTKKEWRKPSRPEYIGAGLATFVKYYRELGISSVAFPPLGCGNGELDYERQVRPLMEEHLSRIDIPVFLYAPIQSGEVAEHRQPEVLRDWLRSTPGEMAFAEVWRDLVELLATHPPIITFAQNTALDVRIDDEQEFLGVRWSTRKIQFPKVAVQEVWTRLRMHGMIRPSMVAVPDASLLFPVLAALPYVAPVRLASNVEGLDDERSWGIQLVPTQIQAQRKLALMA